MTLITEEGNLRIQNKEDDDYVLDRRIRCFCFKKSLTDFVKTIEHWYGTTIDSDDILLFELRCTAKHKDNPALAKFLESFTYGLV